MSSRELPREKSIPPEKWIEKYQYLASTAERLLNNGDVEEGMLHLQQAIALVAENGALVEQGKSLNSLALAQEQSGQTFAARDTLAQAIEVLQQTEDIEQLANALNNLGFVERNMGNLEMARHHHQMALDLLEGVSESREVGRSLSNLGLIYKDKGQLTEAAAYFEASLTYLDDTEEAVRERAHTLLGIGLVQEMLNHVEMAADYYQQALAAYQLAGDQENEALTLHNLGQLADNQGEVMEALGYYFQALSLNLVAKRGNNMLGIAEDLSALAALIWAMQNIVDQEMPVDQPMRLENVLAVHVRSLMQDLAASDVIRGEGRHWVAGWNLEDSRQLARQMQERALKLHEAIGNRRGQIWTLTDLAIWHRDRGDYGAAEQYLREALKSAEGVAAPRELYETYLNLGDVRLMAEEPQGAIVAYELAVAAAEALRARLLVEAEALSYFNELNLIAYERLIRLNAQLNPRQALEWLERAKAREFLRRLRWGAMGRSSQVSAELWQRELEGVTQFRAAAEALNGASESDRLSGLNDYRRAEELVLAVWAEIAAIDPEYVALRQGQPVGWVGLRECLAYE